jgi:import inner membrane translocase subunit TIM50
VGYPNFELVVYTVENAMTFYPIVDGLDPNSQYIMYRLFRDATRYVHGHHTKDLSALNRDPKKVIIIDWNENSVLLNRENTLLLQKWEGDNADRTLIGLAQLLQGENCRNVCRSSCCNRLLSVGFFGFRSHQTV